MSELGEWDSFYVIVASAAGGLIGLQFVVITLISGRPARFKEANAAFATPTILHFSAVLLLSALLRAPWRSIGGPSLLLALLGFAGMLYSIVVVRRMLVQAAYRPELEDWFFHAMVPLAAYSLLAFSAIAARSELRHPLFGIGAAALMLLFTGVHNAWDAAAYHVATSERGGSNPAHPANSTG